MIVRCGRIVGSGDDLKVRIHIRELSYPKQIASNGADVCCRHDLVAANGLLECDVPLISTRKLEVRVSYKNRVDGWICAKDRRRRILGAQRKRDQRESLSGAVWKEA